MAASIDMPVRAGVFETVDDAASAVSGLREAGFTVEEITVVCSDETKERHFRAYEHQQPAGRHSNEALTAAGAVVAGLGGAAVLTTMLATAGTAVFVIGAFAGLAAASTFVGLMTTRGVDKELADYYDQAVQEGKLLVAVEVHGEDAAKRLELGESILAIHGTHPFELPEG